MPRCVPIEFVAACLDAQAFSWNVTPNERPMESGRGRLSRSNSMSGARSTGLPAKYFGRASMPRTSDRRHKANIMSRVWKAALCRLFGMVATCGLGLFTWQSDQQELLLLAARRKAWFFTRALYVVVPALRRPVSADRVRDTRYVAANHVQVQAGRAHIGIHWKAGRNAKATTPKLGHLSPSYYISSGFWARVLGLELSENQDIGTLEYTFGHPKCIHRDCYSNGGAIFGPVACAARPQRANIVICHQ